MELYIKDQFFLKVEAIVATRNHKGKRQFKIRWKGCEESYDSWEYESELNCSDLMEEFLEGIYYYIFGLIS